LYDTKFSRAETGVVKSTHSHSLLPSWKA